METVLFGNNKGGPKLSVRFESRAINTKKLNQHSGISGTQLRLEILCLSKIWRNLLMPLYPAGLITVMLVSLMSPNRPLNATTRKRKKKKQEKRAHYSSPQFFTHQLPIRYKIQFKVLVIFHQSPNGLGSKYISEIFDEYLSGRSNRNQSASGTQI